MPCRYQDIIPPPPAPLRPRLPPPPPCRHHPRHALPSRFPSAATASLDTAPTCLRHAGHAIVPCYDFSFTLTASRPRLRLLALMLQARLCPCFPAFLQAAYAGLHVAFMQAADAFGLISDALMGIVPLYPVAWGRGAGGWPAGVSGACLLRGVPRAGGGRRAGNSEPDDTGPPGTEDTPGLDGRHMPGKPTAMPRAW
jgi:hypothetical protein